MSNLYLSILTMVRITVNKFNKAEEGHLMALHNKLFVHNFPLLNREIVLLLFIFQLTNLLIDAQPDKK